MNIDKIIVKFTLNVKGMKVSNNNASGECYF